MTDKLSSNSHTWNCDDELDTEAEDALLWGLDTFIFIPFTSSVKLLTAFEQAVNLTSVFDFEFFFENFGFGSSSSDEESVLESELPDTRLPVDDFLWRVCFETGFVFFLFWLLLLRRL